LLEREPLAQLADEQLLDLIGSGSEAAFSLLFDRYADRLYRYSLLRLRDPGLAEDAVQETLLAVWQGAAARYSGKSRTSTWLFGICHNKTLELGRTRSRTPADIPPSELELVGGKAHDQAHLAEVLSVRAALAQLSPEQRDVVVLAFYLEQTYAEIAEILDIPEGTVKSRMYHARRNLARHLEVTELANPGLQRD